MLRPTLGVTLVADAARLPTGGRAFVVRSPRDGRVMFVLPAGARTIVGTTDTDWPDRDGRPAAGRRDPGPRRPTSTTCSNRLHHNFPAARPAGPRTSSRTFAGLRPLLASDDADPSATSREHAIWVDPPRRALGGRRQADHHAQHGRGGGRPAIDLLRARGFDRPLGRLPDPHAAAARRRRPDRRRRATTLCRPCTSWAPTSRPTCWPATACGPARCWPGRRGERLAPPAVPDLPHLGAEVLYAARYEHAPRGRGRPLPARAAVPPGPRPGPRRAPALVAWQLTTAGTGAATGQPAPRPSELSGYRAWWQPVPPLAQRGTPRPAGEANAAPITLRRAPSRARPLYTNKCAMISVASWHPEAPQDYRGSASLLGSGVAWGSLRRALRAQCVTAAVHKPTSVQ